VNYNILRGLEEKLEAGEMPQEKYDEFMQYYDEYFALEAEKHKILDRLLELDAEALAYHQLRREHDEMLENLNGLDATIQNNDNAIARLRRMKTMEADEAGATLGVLLSEFPELDIDIPENATIYERIDLVEAALVEETEAARIEQVELQEEIEISEAIIDTVEVTLDEDDVEAVVELVREDTHDSRIDEFEVAATENDSPSFDMGGGTRSFDM